MKHFKFIQHIGIILLILLLSCAKKDEVDIEFNDFSTSVGPEAKTVKFYKKTLDIDASLFPQLTIDVETFEPNQNLSLNYSTITKERLPENFALINTENILWGFDASQKPLKPIQLSLFYDDLIPTMLLDGKKAEIEVYAIKKGLPTFKNDNWEKITAISHDTVLNKMIINIHDFDYQYIFFYNEVSRKDVWQLKITTPQVYRFSDINYEFFNGLTEEGKGLYVKEERVRFSGQGDKNHLGGKAHSFGISIESANIIDFYYRLSSDTVYTFSSGMKITMDPIKNQKEQMKGNVSAWLVSNKNITDSLYAELDFDLTRTR